MIAYSNKPERPRSSFAEKPKKKEKGLDDRPTISALPGGRSSYPDYNGNDSIDLATEYRVVEPDFLREVIPVMRGLMQLNPDVSQAMWNIVSLGNTGHKVFLDRKVPAEQVDQMRNHLQNKRKLWAPGQAGMDGLVNKMFYQIMVSGALSDEWIPDNSLEGIRAVVLVNPESIVFELEDDNITYKPYQRIKNAFLRKRSRSINGDLIPLNTHTYRYYALNGDGESPYGIPPYMSALRRLESQGKMNKNIDHIMDIMGLVGFLEVLVDKPDENDGESEKEYGTRLEKLLDEARARILKGVHDGVVVGFTEDHEFKFNSASRNFDQVVELFKNNELQIGTALKQDPALWGRDYGTSESKANVTFMKMLSELRNIQNLVKENLEYGYALELRLAGYNFDFLTVRFNKSTLQDDYKFRQGEEINVRNVMAKLVAGIIDMDQAADELGYEAPAEKQPRVPWEMLAGKGGSKASEEAEGKKARKGQKNKSAKKTRSDKKAVPKNK